MSSEDANSATIQLRLRQHYHSIGLKPCVAERLSRAVTKWYENSGPVWTVERLKSLASSYQASLQLNTTRYSVPLGWAIKVNRKGHRILADRDIHRIFTDRTIKGLRIARNFLRSHNIFYEDRVTHKQATKFYEAVTAPAHETSNGKHDVSVGLDALIVCNVKSPKVRVERKFVPLAWTPMPASKRAPVYIFKEDDQSFYSDAVVFDRVVTRSRADISTKDFYLALLNDKALNELWSSYPEQVNSCLYGVADPSYEEQSDPSDLCLPAGTIGTIQEPGLKLRTVANPHLLFQALGEPLKVTLRQILDQTPGVYVNNQDKGREVIASWLHEKSRVWCFDASSWTDRFPVSLQRCSLMRLIDEGYATEFDLAVLDLVVNKPFALNKELRDALGVDTVKWEVGQPMGFGPSFFLATLSHRDILYALAAKYGLGDITGQFAIVGDDICIRHAYLAQLYHDAMSEYGVVINMEKSMISDTFAEFCGKLITSGGVIPSIKVKPIRNPFALREAMRFYGSKSFYYLNSREVRWSLLSILPTTAGGLGFNPPGMSYATYLSKINTAQMQYDQIMNDLSEACGASAVNSAALGVAFDMASRFYSRNEPITFSVLSSSELSHHIERCAGRRVVFSEFTGLPAVLSDPDDLALPSSGDLPGSYYNTYRSVCDSSVRSLLSSRGATNVTSWVGPVKPFRHDEIDLDKDRPLLSAYLGSHGYSPVVLSPQDTQIDISILTDNDKEKVVNELSRKAREYILWRGKCPDSGRATIRSSKVGSKEQTKWIREFWSQST